MGSSPDQHIPRKTSPGDTPNDSEVSLPNNEEIAPEILLRLQELSEDGEGARKVAPAVWLERTAEFIASLDDNQQVALLAKAIHDYKYAEGPSGKLAKRILSSIAFTEEQEHREENPAFRSEYSPQAQTRSFVSLFELPRQEVRAALQNLSTTFLSDLIHERQLQVREKSTEVEDGEQLTRDFYIPDSIGREVLLGKPVHEQRPSVLMRLFPLGVPDSSQSYYLPWVAAAREVLVGLDRGAVDAHSRQVNTISGEPLAIERLVTPRYGAPHLLKDPLGRQLFCEAMALVSNDSVLRRELLPILSENFAHQFEPEWKCMLVELDRTQGERAAKSTEAIIEGLQLIGGEEECDIETQISAACAQLVDFSDLDVQGLLRVILQADQVYGNRIYGEASPASCISFARMVANMNEELSARVGAGWNPA
ncbi:MAG: hypothetical protein KDD70_17535, partial [Bdellovibrionales bacterium]|nr:hypothetical protein [Bdellovibrionales bacterium]